MKILIDLTSLAENFSGIERYALNISKEIVENDKNNEYILIFKNNIHKSFLKFKNNENIQSKVIKGKNKLIFNQIILPKELYKIKADKYLFLAFPSPILFKRKGIINTIHDLTAWDYPETMKKSSRIYFKESIKNAIKVSENILTVSNFSQRRIEKQFSFNRVNIIYNGVSDTFLEASNQEVFKLEDRIKRKYCLPREYFMCLCTIEPRKNIELLIKAYTELREENKTQLKLVLVGRKGWKVDNLLREVNEKYINDIIITGFVEDEDLPQIYIGAKAFVFPSLYEGFGIPVLEAMSLGIPVICSDTSSLPEVIGKNGILFANNNKEDLKIKMIEFLNKSEDYIQNLILLGKKRSMLFNWKNEAEKLIKLIKE